MITYEFAKSDLERDASKPQGSVVVLLDNRVVGKIRPVEGGYQYVTKNNSLGEVFSTLRACQKSLEAQ